MAYSDFYLNKQAKIPTILALLIACFVGLLFIRLFTHSATPSKAEKKIVRRFEVANLTSNQVVVYWQTDQKAVGWVVYGKKENELNRVAYDDRDLPQNKLSSQNHYATLKNLDENQTYFFKLINDNKFESNDTNTSLSFKTTKNITGFKGIDPAYGKVIEANGAPAENSVVLLHIGNAFSLATLTKSTGEWLIPLNSLYDKNTYQFLTPKTNEKITIEVIGENQSSQIVADLLKVSPLPQTIILGKNFDFTSPENVLSATSTRTVDISNNEIDIVYPKEDALIPGYSPLIKGIALPGSEVFITVHSDKVFSSRVKADDKGLWSLILPSSLSPGDHTITIKTVDKDGNPVTVDRKFIIAKNGEQVLGSATPEATITEMPSPTPTTQLYFTPTPKPPVSGGSIGIPLVGAFSFIIVGVGLMLVF